MAVMRALAVCLAWICLLPELEGKAFRHKGENAFDKIAEIDLHYGQIKDWKHYEGDMKLPPIVHTKNRRTRRSLDYRQVRLWPGGVVPYTISQELKRKPSYYKLIKQAMKTWEKKTCIKFKKRTAERNYAHIFYGPGCQSDVGIAGGMQTTSIGEGCNDVGIIVHELGHLLGLYHEQNRPDRDKYIKVLWDNIKPTLRHTYEIKQGWNPKSVRGPYDYYSIMHYGSGDFSRSYGMPTMKALKSHITKFGGNLITALDAKKIKNMYNCPAYPDYPRDFYWSHSRRRIPGRTCVRINEPNDPYWKKSSLCYRNKGKIPLNLRWSSNGPIRGMSCERIFEPTKPRSYTWYNNYICLPTNVPYTFKWMLTKPSRSERRNCLKINNPRDGTWTRKYHYLCAESSETKVIDGKWVAWGAWSKCTRVCGGGVQFRERTCSNPPPSNGGRYCKGPKLQRTKCNKKACSGLPSFPEDFSFGFHELPPFRDHCLRTYDLMNYFTWVNYYFCSIGSKGDPGFRWGMGRPIPDMRCTKIYNDVENRYIRGSWKSNYLCVPPSSPYRFMWSTNGPIPGKKCLRWYAKKGKDGWSNKYLCKEGTSMRG